VGTQLRVLEAIGAPGTPRTGSRQERSGHRAYPQLRLGHSCAQGTARGHHGIAERTPLRGRITVRGEQGERNKAHRLLRNLPGPRLPGRRQPDEYIIDPERPGHRTAARDSAEPDQASGGTVRVVGTTPMTAPCANRRTPGPTSSGRCTWPITSRRPENPLHARTTLTSAAAGGQASTTRLRRRPGARHISGPRREAVPCAGFDTEPRITPCRRPVSVDGESGCSVRPTTINRLRLVRQLCE
jgi:hypothetical protein